MKTKEELDDCLDFDLFQGDFGDQDDIELSNKLVTGRKKYTCFVCYGDIQPGEVHRSMVSKYYAELKSYRCCNTCCSAMVESVNGDYLGTYDGEDPIDARYTIGQQKRAEANHDN